MTFLTQHRLLHPPIFSDHMAKAEKEKEEEKEEEEEEEEKEEEKEVDLLSKNILMQMT